jgi:hypothetical protein
MTRGIHLKQITNTDLGLLGLPEALLPTEVASAGSRPLAGEMDPALARIIQEVLATLEEAQALLDQALALGQEPTPIRAPSQDRSAQTRP